MGRPIVNVSRVCAVLALVELVACAKVRPGFVAADAAVRVLVFNIHAGKDAAGVDNLAGVATLVRETQADLVLLQEVDRHTRRSSDVDQVATLASRTGFHAAFGKTLDYDGGQYGIAMLSRWPISRDTLIHLPIDPPQARAGGSYEPRGAQRMRVSSPLGPLVVFNTHLDASREDNYRRQEGQSMIALVATARSTGDLVIAGGDFNSEPESAVQQALRASGLRDAWMTCGSGQPLTYPDDKPVKRIDYLFLTGPLVCRSARVIESRVSDHRPVLFTVVVRR
jgi:endonuclease/exonuclease/phosphatase family metal-dependent hydrolase